MGGLVMQEYFKSGVSSGRNDSCITLITVGTPFHGVGGRSLEAFTRGYNFGNPKLSLYVAKEFVIETFSAYDLLPQPQLQPIPTINFEDYMKHIAVGDFHADRIRTRECFTRPRSYYIYTSGVPTPHDISITQSNIDGEISNTFLDGDGTVPSVSATNSGCHKEHPINLMITSDHMEMLNNLRFLGIVLWIVKSPCPDISGYYRCSDDTIVHVEHTVPSFDMTHGWYAIGKIGNKEARYYTPREYCGQYIFRNTEIHCLKRGSAPLTGLSPSFKNWTQTIECPKDYELVDGLCLRNVTTVVYQCGEGSKLVDGKCTAISVIEEKEVGSQTLTAGLAVLSVVGITAAVALAVLHFKKRKPVVNFQPLTTELEEVSIERVT